MSNKLAILVSFMGQNQLSREIRTIVTDSKKGVGSIKALASESARLKKELDQVNRELRETTGIHPALLNRQAALQRQLEKTTAAMDSQRRQMERIDTIQRRAGKVGNAAMTAGAVTTAAVTVPVLGGAKAAIEQAMATEELNSAYAVTFGKQTAEMNRWAEETGDTMGRSTQEMQRFANSFGLLFTKSAKPEKAAEMSRSFAVLAQDLSSFYDKNPQEAMEGLMSGLSGEAEPMRKFGVFLTEAKVKAKALELGLMGVGNELTEEEKIMARYQIILDETGKAQGDVTRTSGSATNKLRELKGQWEEQQVAIGQKLLPVIPPLADALIAVLTAFNGLSPETQKFVVYALLAGAALGPMLIGLGSLAFAVRNIAGTIGGAVTLFGRLRAISLKATTAFGLVKNGFALLRVGAFGFARAMLLVGRALLLNPIGIVVTAIGVGAYMIWRHWDKIKGAFNAGVAALGRAWNWVKSNAGNILMLAGPIGIAASLIWRHWDTIKKAFSGALSFVRGVAGNFLSAGRAIIDGLVAGITSAPGKIWAALKSIIGGAWQKSKEFLGIASPSRLFAVMGGHISQGLALGIDRGSRQPIGSMRRLAGGVAAAGALSLSPAMAGDQIRPAARPAAASSASPFGAAPITINIYPRDGQDAKSIAKEVARELEKASGVKRRGAFDDEEA